MEIKRIAVYGAGGIGAYIIQCLSDNLGENLFVIAEGERKERLSKEGLIINGRHYDLNVKTPEEAQGVDLLLVSVKYTALRGILPGVKEIAGLGKTGIGGHAPIVMSLMNGIDSEEILSEVVDPEQIVYSMIRISSERQGNDIFIHPVEADMGVYFGDLNKNNDEEKVQAVKALFDDNPIVYTLSEDIQRMMWFKFAFNNAENQAQAILDVGLGAYRESEHVGWFRTQLWNECKAIAAKQGIDIGEEPGYLTPTPHPNSTAYSTWQDVRAKRQTEVEMLAGTVMRLGDKLGVPVPASTAVYHMLSAVDERSAGKFDF